MKLKFINAIIIIWFISGCVISNPKSTLRKYDFKNKKSVSLAHKLNEISGIAVTPDGRVFTHNDEKGIVYQINYESGEIIKEFYLTTSDGILFEFTEGNNKQPVEYKTYQTGVSSDYNIEGLCYDKKTNSLLFVCKDFPGKNYKGNRAVYAFSLKDYKIISTPRFLISLKELKEKFGIKHFYPSGIEKHPISNSYFIISAKDGSAIIEVSETGEIIDGKLLGNKTHTQPEGISFLSNSDLIIGDEGAGKKGTITVYKKIN